MACGRRQATDADTERIRCGLEVVTNREMKDNGLCEVLTPEAWRDRRDRLRQLGGAPLP
jgi:hypothetical protein